MIARVLPDVAGIRKTFDYLVPPGWEDEVQVGTMVRVALSGRRIGGWVVAVVDEPATDKPLAPLAKITGLGPAPDVVALARWAAWRWAGRTTSLLRTASPPFAVRAPLPRRAPGSFGPRPPLAAGTPAPPPGPAEAPPPGLGPPGSFGPRPPLDFADLFARPRAVVRVPPGGDVEPLVAAASALGDALVVSPSLSMAGYLAARLRRQGHDVALMPRDWARAAAGGCVAIGARAAAWAPRPRLDVVVVLDEHDEAHQEERGPTWNARDVALERAERAGAPCILMSPCPSLEALAAAPLVTLGRGAERAGWPALEVVDRREEPPGAGLYSPRLVAAVRATAGADRVVCVLNRKGRARLLVCTACGEVARCERCQAAVEQTEAGFWCRRCDTTRPAMCTVCSGIRLKALRPGVSRAREELELLVGVPVAEVTAATPAGPLPDVAVLVGTEAVLHRAARAGLVVFLDFDQELLAPRYRAAEQALALLARAARVVGGRDGGGRLLVQTRAPDHEVLDAVTHADPSRVAVVESARRAALRLPPESSLALVSGAAAPVFAETLRPDGRLEVLGPTDGHWLVRAANHQHLCDALAAAPRPPGRLRVEVDPLRA